MSDYANKNPMTVAKKGILAALTGLPPKDELPLVLHELSVLKADVAEIKRHLIRPTTPIITGNEAITAYRRLLEGGAA